MIWPDSLANQTFALITLESCVRDIRNWMLASKLMINDGKTEFILIGTKKQLAKVDVSHLTIGEAIDIDIDFY